VIVTLVVVPFMVMAFVIVPFMAESGFAILGLEGG
jgi:hypothetical protein